MAGRPVKSRGKEALTRHAVSTSTAGAILLPLSPVPSSTQKAPKTQKESKDGSSKGRSAHAVSLARLYRKKKRKNPVQKVKASTNRRNPVRIRYKKKTCELVN